jgi:hypothetical protein
MGTWEHIKLEELPQHNALGFFCWGRFLKIHTEIKRGVVYRALFLFGTSMVFFWALSVV